MDWSRSASPESSLRDMRKSSRSRKRLYSIPKATFARLVKEISEEVRAERDAAPLKWSAEGVDALQEETEAYLEHHFSKAKRLLDTFNQRTVGLKHFNDGRALE